MVRSNNKVSMCMCCNDGDAYKLGRIDAKRQSVANCVRVRLYSLSVCSLRDVNRNVGKWEVRKRLTITIKR